jgi:hypothetical protein
MINALPILKLSINWENNYIPLIFDDVIASSNGRILNIFSELMG